jgi:hypothetical protein
VGVVVVGGWKGSVQSGKDADDNDEDVNQPRRGRGGEGKGGGGRNGWGAWCLIEKRSFLGGLSAFREHMNDLEWNGCHC